METPPLMCPTVLDVMNDALTTEDGSDIDVSTTENSGVITKSKVYHQVVSDNSVSSNCCSRKDILITL